MRAYISGQITGKTRTDISIMAKMVQIAEEKGVEVYFPERDTNNGELDSPSITPEEIYERDTKAIKQSELIVIECSNPSTGNGMEIMLAYLFDKVIICAYEKGAVVSRILLGMPSIEFIVYENEEDLKKKFLDILAKQVVTE